LLLLFVLQGLLAGVFALPALAAASDQRALGSIDAAAIVVFVVAWWGGSLADRQLARFKADPAHHGTVCDIGLWRYSRHPNYFCEWILWCALLPLGWGSPLALLALTTPLVLFVLLNFVTGIPPAEARSLAVRGERYRHYQQRTSAFFPWPPREVAS
jgi:steroid 5-alpha reductase family enzyme